MNYIISDGSTKDIVIGSLIRVIKGSLSEEFYGRDIEIKAVDASYPYAQLEPSQLSAIDPKIIKAVI